MKRRSGLALVIVISVLLALLLIATPFVISMIEQEKSSKAYLVDARAELTAESARTAAVAYLYNTNDAYERRSLNPNFQSYSFDLPAELAVDFRTALPEAPPPRDALEGIAVQDEQGKINLRTAPALVVQRLREEALASGRSLRDLATLYSGRDTAWAFPQRVRAADDTVIWIDSLDVVCAGTKVRITKPDLAPIFAVVAGVSSTGGLITTPAVPVQYRDGILEVEVRHPVNLLTAPREVLIALLEDLLLVYDPPEKPLGRLRAEQIADLIRSNAPTDMGAFKALISLAPLTDNQRTAILVNAVTPTSTGIRLGTDPGGSVPFCFKSYDVFTIETAGAVVRGPGAPASVRGFREVVALSPPHALEWTLESQFDFQSFFDLAYGNRIRTLPFPLPPWDMATANPDAGFTIRPADDLRGSVKLRESYPTEIEGFHLNAEENEAVVYPWDQVLDPFQGAGDILAGGLEMWWRFNGPPRQADLFRIQEGPYENRISVTYDNGYLTLSVADATLPTIDVGNANVRNGFSRIRVPLTAVAGRWYHCGAFWKGTKFAQLLLLVDGFVPPKSKFEILREDGNSVLTELSSGAVAGSTVITLKDNTWIPIGPLDPPTPVEIGREVVEFDPKTGLWTRGARGTTAADHPSGVKASLFGYSQKIATAQIPPQSGFTGSISALTVGGGKNTYKFGPTPFATVVTQISAGNATIAGVGTIDQFPDKGYILINFNGAQEIVYYDQKGTSSFDKCSRGQNGTAALDLDVGATIQLYSVAVDNTAGYQDPAVFQIDDEWFIGKKDTARAGFFLGGFFTNLNLPLQRGAFGTAPQQHEKNVKVIPVFAAAGFDYTRVSEIQCGNGDWVTVCDGADNRESQRIHHVWHPTLPGTPPPPPTFQLVGFNDWVARDYASGDALARLLKFPSGELISQTWLTTKAPSASIGLKLDEIDEIKFYAMPKGDFYALAAVNSNDNTMTMNSSASLMQKGGAVKVGDEIIGYSSVDTAGVLQGLKRGYLGPPAGTAGSTASVHDAGDRAFHLTGLLQIASLNSSIVADAAAIPVSQPMTMNPEGFVYIDSEVLGYHQYNSQNGLLGMPTTFDGKGMWRGRFGTSPALHNKGALVYAIPFRYWDTYAPGQWDERMCHFAAGRTVRGARWRDLRFEATTEPKMPDGADDPNVIVHARVKVGATSSWTNLRDVIESTGGKPLPIGRMGDTCDLQVMFEYAPDSFYPAHAWKTRPIVRRVVIGYDAPTQTLYHEE